MRLRAGQSGFRLFRGSRSEVCGNCLTDVHDYQRVCKKDYRLCAGQVQCPPVAENPDYLELRRGTEAGREKAGQHSKLPCSPVRYHYFLMGRRLLPRWLFYYNNPYKIINAFYGLFRLWYNTIILSAGGLTVLRARSL